MKLFAPLGTVALLFALLAAASAGCSSSSDADDDPCPFVGTYVMTGKGDPTAGCQADPPSPDAGAPPASSAPQPITVVISAPRTPGGPHGVQLQGFQGGCNGEVVSSCKLQTQCAVTLTDALDPANNEGTFQFSWTFTKDGFSGLNSVAFPPIKGYSKGCSGNSEASAVRR